MMKARDTHTRRQFSGTTDDSLVFGSLHVGDSVSPRLVWNLRYSLVSGDVNILSGAVRNGCNQSSLIGDRDRPKTSAGSARSTTWYSYRWPKFGPPPAREKAGAPRGAGVWAVTSCGSKVTYRDEERYSGGRQRSVRRQRAQ
eukprot:1551879-Prymnesium_polylepis.1